MKNIARNFFHYELYAIGIKSLKSFFILRKYKCVINSCKQALDFKPLTITNNH